MKSFVLTTFLIGLISLSFVGAYDTSSILNKILDDAAQSKSTKDLFKIWHFVFHKEQEYSLENEITLLRYKTFKANLKKIKEHNANGQYGWTNGLNYFSDLTDQEFADTYLMKTRSNNRLNTSAVPINGFENRVFYYSQNSAASYTPLDWRSKCPTIRNQAGCGSCYAFAMITAIECNYNIETNASDPAALTLSKQQIIDCDPTNNGCRGGDPQYASLYAVSQGLFREEDYKYVQQSGTCRYDSLISQNNIKPQKYISGIDTLCYDDGWNGRTCQYTAGVYKLLQRGPLATAINASILRNYKSGIINVPVDCSGVNHVVTIVGFGNDSQYGNYYIIQNTWGGNWGESGYYRMAANDVMNNCIHEITRPFLNIK